MKISVGLVKVLKIMLKMNGQLIIEIMNIFIKQKKLLIQSLWCLITINYSKKLQEKYFIKISSFKFMKISN